MDPFQMLRDLHHLARTAPDEASRSATLEAIRRLERDVLVDARAWAGRSVALVALLLQTHQDEDGELEELHGALAGAADVQIAALDKALHKRGVSR